MDAAEFKAWLKRHRDACPRGDWPAEAAFYAAWKRRLDRLGADYATACQATDRVAESPPDWPRQHLDAVVNAVLALWRDRKSEVAESASSGRKLSEGEYGELRRLSRDCLSCGGHGIAVRRGHRTPGRSVTAYCSCPLGRWTRARHEQDAPDLARRFADLAEHPWMDHPAYGGPAEHEAADERRRARLWEEMDEADRDSYRERARREVGAVRRFPRFAEAAARDLAFRERFEPAEAVGPAF